MKIVIIGGGAGGASTAARLRRLDEFAEIVLVDKADSISQATCGIPYHIGEVIKDRDRMVVVEAESFAELLNVDVQIRMEVIAIDPQKRLLTVLDHKKNHKKKITYDKLVLSPGASPVYPPIPGVDNASVFTLNNLEQMDRITQYINDHNCKNAVVIGGGFIGLEAADNLKIRGIKTSLIEASSQVMAPLDPEMASFLHQHIHSHQINLLLNNKVIEICDDHIVLENGKKIDADLVILAIGAKPQTQLAEQAGLRIGESGGIYVNRGLLSTVDNIYVLGDAVESVDQIYNNKAVIQLAGPAHKQATIVASNILGGHEKYHSMQATSIVKVFDMTAATTGYSEKQLRAQNIAYKKSYSDIPAHASFYPESFPLTIKLLFSPNSGKILGAQIVGVRGVDKRIDVIASVIQLKGTIFDMAEMELAYAPPYSSAKDPINIAGMVARNMLRDGYQVVFWDELDFHVQDEAVVIDVRTPDEFELNHIDGAINIPLEKLRASMKQLDKNKKYILCCQQGKKSYFAWRIMSQHGFKHVFSLSGGLKIYFSAISPALQQESYQENKLAVSNGNRMQNETIDENILFIDAVGLSCPGPIMKLNKEIRSIEQGHKLRVSASDPGFVNDISVWCKKTGHILEACDTNSAVTTVVIQKAS
ncbi:MAG: FAD-dependent oxidoreductase [Gammaproteobacteria bacterium]|nr:FAD-dependent oxidoreductase [Gammaproteobacteria bacterium]